MSSKESPPGSGKTFELNIDADAMREELSAHYFALADDLRAAGLEPNSVPQWEAAAKAFFDIKDALKQYERPKTQEQVNALEERISRAVAYFNSEVTPAIDAVIAKARSAVVESAPVATAAIPKQESIKAALLKENIRGYESKQQLDAIAARAEANLKEGWTAEEFSAYEGTREEMKKALSEKIEKLKTLTWGSGESAEVAEQDIDAGVLARASTERKPKVKPEALQTPAVTDLESARAIMTASGEAYFAAYKELHKNGLAHADSGPEKEALDELKRTYDATRAAYYRDSLKEGADWATLQKEVLFESVERETALKIEALSEKQRGTLMKAVEWYGGMNRGLEARFGKTGSRAIRALVGGVVVFGSFSAFGGAGTLAAAGYGSWRAAKAFLGSYVGGAAAEVAGGWFKSRAMKAADAARARLGIAGATLGNELSIDDIERMDAQRRKLSYDASEAKVARKVVLGKALVAVGFGYGLSLALADAVVEADIQSSASGPPAQPAVSAATAETPVAPVVEKPAASAIETPAINAAPAVPEGLDDMNAVVDEIHEVTAMRGDGAIRMLDRLHDDLVAKGITPDSPGISPEMKAVLEADTPAEVAELAKKFGFYDPDNVHESAVITRGASLKFEDGKLMFTQAGGTPQVISETAKFSGTFDDNTPRPAPVERTETVTVRDTQTAAPSTRVTPGPAVSSADASYDTDPRYSQEEVRARVLAQREAIAPEPQAQSSASPPVERAPEPPVQDEPQDVQPSNPEIVINRNGVEVNSTRAAVYADRNGIVIVHGGTVAERAAEAARYLVENPKAEIYFDSSTVNPLTGQVEPHLSRLKALPNGSLPLTAVDERDVLGADMRGRRLPAVDDLYRKIVDYP